MKKTLVLTLLLLSGIPSIAIAVEGTSAAPRYTRQASAAPETQPQATPEAQPQTSAPQASAAPEIQLAHEHGLFVGFQFGPEFYHSFLENGFCAQRWKNPHCQLTRADEIGLTGQLEVGYRFTPYLSVTVGAKFASFTAEKNDDKVPDDAKTEIIHRTEIVSVNGFAKFYPLLLTEETSGRKAKGLYLGAGGGYTWVQYGNLTKRDVEVTSKFHISTALGYEYPVTSRAVIGFQAGFNYYAPPTPFIAANIMGNLAYYFF